MQKFPEKERHGKMSELRKADQAKKYALAAAICFAIYTVYKVIEESGYISSYSTLAILVTIVEIIGYAGLTAAALIRNRKLALIAAGACFCVKAYLFISYLSAAFGLLLLAYAALAVIILLSIKGQRLRYFWYIPCLLLLVRWLYITKSFSFDMGVLLSADNRLGYLALFVEMAAFLFAGLWLKEESAAT